MKGIMVVAAALLLSVQALATVVSGFPTLEEGWGVQRSFRDKRVLKRGLDTVVQHINGVPALGYNELVGRLAPGHAERKAIFGKVAETEYYSFVPEYLGAIKAGQPLRWTSGDTGCFGVDSATLTLDGAGAPVLTFDVEKGKSLLCSDFYLLATFKSWHEETFATHGKHTVKWESLDADEQLDVQLNGFRVFRFREGMPHTLEDVYETVKLFLGAMKKDVPGVPAATAHDNLAFLKERANYDFPVRNVTDVDIDLLDVQSGDMFGILRLDGLDPLIAWGTGSRLGHTTVALEFEDGMYVCESQVKSNYWPTNFVQRTPLKQWVKQAKEADYNAILLPLSAESRSKFNVTAARNFFKTVEGNLYGYEALLMGWIDTAFDNYPIHLDPQLVMIIFALLDPLLTKFVYKDIPNIWSGALNKRLGTDGLTVAQAYAEMERRKMTFSQLITMPEQDKWVYKGCSTCNPPYPAGPAMVCNVFVTNLWRAAGVLGGVDINAGEFTPLDTYSLAIFEHSPKLPQACREADPDNTQFCQILGKYRIELPNYNTEKPFDHMREHCPSLAPDYEQRLHNATVQGMC